jgi:hypothetical protein
LRRTALSTSSLALLEYFLAKISSEFNCPDGTNFSPHLFPLRRGIQEEECTMANDQNNRNDQNRSGQQNQPQSGQQSGQQQRQQGSQDGKNNQSNNNQGNQNEKQKR